MHNSVDSQEQPILTGHFHLTATQELPDLPADDPLAREWKAFKHEVVRLLAEGYEGRFALVKCDAVHSLWDTRADAMQAGWLLFGQTTFLVQEIEATVRPLRSGYSRKCQP
jgi:hypothetical protein